MLDKNLVFFSSFLFSVHLNMYYVHCAGCPKVKISTYILCKVFTSKHVKYTLCAGCPLSNSCHLQMYNVQHVNLNMYNITRESYHMGRRSPAVKIVTEQK